MVTISRLVGMSTMAVLAASTLLLLGRLGRGDDVASQGAGNATASRKADVVEANPLVVGKDNADFYQATTSAMQAAARELGNRASAALARQARAATLQVTTRALLIRRSILEQEKIVFELTVPGHHVRPVSADTPNGAAVLDDTVVGRLLKAAQADPTTHDNNPQAEAYPDDEAEFICLSEPYRDPPKFLPNELSSAVINGLSVAFTASTAADHQKVVFSPISVKRADYPAGSALAGTASSVTKELPATKVLVPNGGTLLIDAGPVKANPKETTPSRQLVVLVQPKLLARAGK